MSRKNFVKSFKSIDATSGANMGADITGEVSNVEGLDNIGLFVKWTSANAVGVISVQGSINYDKQNSTGDWEDLTFDPVLTQPNSDDGSYLININQFPYPFMRVFYDRTSGTGSLNVWFSAKSVGA